MSGKPPPAQPGWASFWSDGGGQPRGCLPKRAAGLDAPRRAAWVAFARGLPKGARVLDLASGSGQVLADLLAARRDLRPVGVDLAPALPPPPRGAKLRCGVNIEALPFRAGSFAAATSQFGIEYADLPKAIAEMARILAPGGQAALMTHHPQSPVLAHNLRRAEGLRWVLGDAGLIGRAKAGLALRQAGVALPPAIAAAPGEAERRFGRGSGGWELAAAIVQALELGARSSLASLANVLDTLEFQARGEIARIDALEKAGRAVSDEAALAGHFVAAELLADAPERLIDGDSRMPFATLWRLRRPHAKE